MSEPTDVLDSHESTGLDESTDGVADTNDDVSEPNVVGDDGLINVNAVDENLRDQATLINEQVERRISEMTEEIERTRVSANNWQTISTNPEAIRYLYERQFGKAADAASRSQSEDLDFNIELDVDDDDFADTGGFKKVAQQIAKQTGLTLKQAMGQLEKRITDRITQAIAPTVRALGQTSKVAKWQSVVSRYPDADTTPYRKEIERVLASGRVQADDYEAAFEIADARLQRSKRSKDKTDSARRKGRAGSAASRAAPHGNRADADSLRTKGGGWLGAVRLATKQIGSLPKS